MIQVQAYQGVAGPLAPHASVMQADAEIAIFAPIAHGFIEAGDAQQVSAPRAAVVPYESAARGQRVEQARQRASLQGARPRDRHAL